MNLQHELGVASTRMSFWPATNYSLAALWRKHKNQGKHLSRKILCIYLRRVESSRDVECSANILARLFYSTKINKI